MSFIYVASPYTHPSPLVREARMLLVEAYVVEKQRKREGKLYYSPIVYAHALGNRYVLPKEVDFWHSFNLPAIHLCSKIEVLKLPGWRESRGITWELEEGTRLHKVIEYVEVNEPAKLLGLA